MNNGIQVYFQNCLMNFLFQQLNDLFKSKNPCSFYQDRFFPELRGTELTADNFLLKYTIQSAGYITWLCWSDASMFRKYFHRYQSACLLYAF